MTLFGVDQTHRTSDDYYTPEWLFDAMGVRFDLDVCAPPSGVPWVPADEFFTMAEDGLSREWRGRVWMNPPYSNVTPWITKFVAHGNGVALLPFTKAEWFYRLWNTAPALVVVGRSTSHFIGGQISTPTFLVAFGVDCIAAVERCGVLRRLSPGSPSVPATEGPPR